jgi:hypothetical protein
MIVNSPPRGYDFNDHLIVPFRYVTNGGTWSKDPLNYATDAQLSVWGSNGYSVVYSVCLQRSPQQEVDEIARYKSFGIKVDRSRLGNEEDDGSVLDNSVDPWEAGWQYADAYVAKAAAYKQAIETAYPDMEFILTAPFPSNQQTQKQTMKRIGWCARIDQEPLAIGVDMHVYDRCNPINKIDMSLAPAFEGRKRFFLEVGAIPVFSQDIWMSRSIETLQMVRAIAREGDEVGVQVMENNVGIGLIMNKSLTAWGDHVVSMDWRKVAKIYDRLSGIPSPFKFLIIKFDNGDEEYWNGWYTNAPVVGTYIDP